jgi:hypothetical protein
VVLQIEMRREVRVVASRPSLVVRPQGGNLEAVVVDTNTFITPALTIKFCLFRDLQDEWRQGRPQCRESPLCGREIVELGINIIKSRT